MPRATNQDGSLAYLNYTASGGGECKIVTPCGTICLKILPDITDSKTAQYVNEPIPGRSTPLISYAYSDPRTISTELHFMITKFSDIQENMRNLRIIQNLVYPGASAAAAPFTPPPVVKFVCGSLMDGGPASAGGGVCLVLKSYSVRYDPGVAWDPTTFLPYRFTISCSWEVVYSCINLPSNRCVAGGFNNVFFPGDQPSQGNQFYQKRMS
jgi:hypothetical protein